MRHPFAKATGRTYLPAVLVALIVAAVASLGAQSAGRSGRSLSLTTQRLEGSSTDRADLSKAGVVGDAGGASSVSDGTGVAAVQKVYAEAAKK